MKELDFDLLVQDVIDEHLTLETQLLILLVRNLMKHDDLLEEDEWYFAQLVSLGALNKQVVQLVSKYTKRSLKDVETVLERIIDEIVDIDLLDTAFKQGYLNKPPSSLALEDLAEKRYNGIRTELDLIGQTVVKETNKQYREAITKAHTEIMQGGRAYEDVIREVINDFGRKGITGATYVRNGKKINYTLEGVVRRDVINSVSDFANEVQNQIVEELGADYVYVSEHLGARDKYTGHANHAEWQGKVYKVDGFDQKFDNFYTVTGAGLVDGFGGVNCRHIKYAFFPDIQEIPERRVDREENKLVYDLVQQQRRYERQVRRGLRELKVAEASGDEELIERKKRLLTQRRKRLREHVVNNKQYLKRYYDRETI